MGAVEVNPKRPTRLLVASGDSDARAGVREALASLPCEIEEASSAREAVAAAEREGPDLVISEMVLRDATGIALCRLLREHPQLSGVPIVLLSTFKEEMDRILAFEAGVDDFITAPYYRRELLSRVRAILRRAQATRDLPAVQAARGPVRLDLDGRWVELFGERIDLTPKEFRIFAVLVRNDRRVLSRDRIIDEVWDGAVTDPRAVDAHIKVIRRKLGPLSSAIQTVRGVGFRYAPPEADRDGRKWSEGDSPSLSRAS
jgi:two-component system alkaline phosphatase synthesis response regulator PhoP